MEEATRWVKTVDRERTAFIRNHFFLDPTDVQYYDLILNVARFDPVRCADLIVEAVSRL